MDIHRPKPLHGWRAFIGEVGIIVLGVLVALAAEQLASWFEWRHKAHAAEEAMRLELRDDDGPQFYARGAMHACLQDTLTAIRTAAETGADRATLVRLIARYKTDFWTWDALAFNAATASEVPLHLPSKRMQRWTLAYSTMPAINQANGKEFADGAELAALSHSGGALRADERDRLLRAVELLRRDEQMVFIVVRVTLPLIYATGVRLDPAAKRHMLARVRANYGAACVTVPKEPGAAELSDEA